MWLLSRLLKSVICIGLLILFANAITQPLIRPERFGGANPEARPGGTLVVGTVDLASTYNPFTARVLSTVGIIDLFLPSLVSFNNASLTYECYLCLSYEFSEDGTTITYSLRENVKWSDGQSITAEDVMLSIALHSDPQVNSRIVSAFNLGGEPIRWEQVDERTIRQILPQIDAAALDLAHFPIVPAHIFGPLYEAGGAEAVQEFWNTNTPPSELVSGGPFKVVEYRINEEIVLERNPNYFVEDEFGNQLPYLDRLIVRGAADSNALLAGFLAGELDLFVPELIDEVLSIQDAIQTGRLDVKLIPDAAYTGVTSTLHPNFQNPDPFKTELFRDVRFRRAISHLVDRESIIELALGGLGIPNYGPFSPGNTRFFNPDAFVEGETQFSFNPQAAADLLAELGFIQRNAAGLLIDDEGRTIAFTILGNASEPVQRAAGQIIAEDMREAGLDVTVAIVDNTSVIAPARRNFNEDGSRNFDWMFTNFGGVADPPTRRNLYSLDGSSRLWNLARPGEMRPERLEPFEEELARLADAALATLNEEERFAIYTEFQRVAAANLPLVYLYAQSLNFAYSSKLGNTQDQLEDPITAFQGSLSGYFGQIINYLDVVFIHD
jgi:peptide/nickel transport system substrate-binding protein